MSAVGSLGGSRFVPTAAGRAVKTQDYNPVAVTLEGCLHRFVRPESLGVHDQWICTRREMSAGLSSLRVPALTSQGGGATAAIWCHSHIVDSRPSLSAHCRALYVSVSVSRDRYTLVVRSTPALANARRCKC